MATTGISTKGKLDPKMFKFESVMARTKPPEPKTVSVFLRPDLIPRIEELQGLLEAGVPDGGERAIGDADPTAQWEDELDGLIEEFNQSELQFEFRAVKFSDDVNARAAMLVDNRDLDDDNSQNLSISYMLGQTCVNAGWSGSQWHDFREKIGEAAFLPLLQTSLAANSGPGVTAPFSRRPSRGLTNEK